jgi:hypothetical protein
MVKLLVILMPGHIPTLSLTAFADDYETVPVPICPTSQTPKPCQRYLVVPFSTDSSAMAAPLMSLHITHHTERFPTPFDWATEWLLPVWLRVWIFKLEGRGNTLVHCRAYVATLRKWEARRRRSYVMVMLPGIRRWRSEL